VEEHEFTFLVEFIVMTNETVMERLL